MDLRRLRYFAAVAEELSFAGAARRLGVSQPPLSRHVRLLEEELGTSLLDRTRRRVRLTPAGRVLLEETLKILEYVDASVSYLRSTFGGRRKKLDVGYVQSANLRVLPRILRRFCRLHPKVALSLHALSAAEQLRGLTEGRLDVGLMPAPASSRTCVFEPLSSEGTVLAIPENHPLSKCSRVRREALRSVPQFHLDGMDAGGASAGPKGPVDSALCPRLTLASADVYDHLCLAAAGIGVSHLPESVVEVRRKGVIYRRLDPPGPTVRIALARRRGAPNPEVIAFFEVARRLFCTPN